MKKETKYGKTGKMPLAAHILAMGVVAALVLAGMAGTGAAGEVWTWGRNDLGQLGDGTTINRLAPVQISGLTGVTAIVGGSGQTVALKLDGTVWTWGRNDLGQLGDGTTINRLTPVQVSGLTGVTAIAAASGHTVALKLDGTVWTWGYNNVGQLGDGTTTQRLTPVQVSGLTGVTAIASGYFHTVALKSDGIVWTWGQNDNGELGDGTTCCSLTTGNIGRQNPVQVSGFTGVTAIADGLSYTIALTTTPTTTTPVSTTITPTITQTSSPTPTSTPSIASGTFYSDSSWLTTGKYVDGWNSLGFDDSSWWNVKVLGTPPVGTWGDINNMVGTNAQWIWYLDGTDNVERFFRKTFIIDKQITAALLKITADDDYYVYINGNFVGKDTGDGAWKTAEIYEIGEYLQQGKNVIAVKAKDTGGPEGLLAELTIKLSSTATPKSTTPAPITPALTTPSPTPAVKQPMLTVSQTTLKEDPEVGEEVLITVTVQNNGDGTAKNIRLTEQLPSSITVSFIDGATSNTPNIVTWNGELAPNRAHAIVHTLTIQEKKSRAIPVIVRYEDEAGNPKETSTTIYVEAQVPATPAPTKMLESTPVSTPRVTIPGFTGLLVLVGLLAAIALVRRR